MMLHENWRDYSIEEIRKITAEHCKGCPYLKRFGWKSVTNQGVTYCDYLSATGKLRRCRPEECTHQNDVVNKSNNFGRSIKDIW